MTVLRYFIFYDILIFDHFKSSIFCITLSKLYFLFYLFIYDSVFFKPNLKFSIFIIFYTFLSSFSLSLSLFLSPSPSFSLSLKYLLLSLSLSLFILFLFSGSFSWSPSLYISFSFSLMLYICLLMIYFLSISTFLSFFPTFSLNFLSSSHDCDKVWSKWSVCHPLPSFLSFMLSIIKINDILEGFNGTPL